MATISSFPCRLGIHRYRRWSRDAEGRFWCQRCGKQGKDAYLDPERLPPGGGGTSGT